MRDFPPEVTASDIPTTRVPSAFLRWMVRDQFAVVFSMTLLVVAWQLPSVLSPWLIGKAIDAFFIVEP